MVPVTYHITDPNHPFSKINGITGSLDISKILDEIPKEEVYFVNKILK